MPRHRFVVAAILLEHLVAASTEIMNPVESILSDRFALGHCGRFECALKTKRSSAMEAQVSELLICHEERATGSYVRLARGTAAGGSRTDCSCLC